jgi:hypothetical protein
MQTDNNEIDLFENYHLLPKEVQDILSKYDDNDNTYENCESLVKDLEVFGYTCDYDLDACPYDLRLI